MSENTIFAPVTVGAGNPTENGDIYDALLYKALRARAIHRGMVPDSSEEEQILRLHEYILRYLRSTDFYDAPASSKYHDVFTGGLVFHNLKVYNQAIELLNLSKFKMVDPASAAFVALTHDWCKIDQYVSYLRNVKDDITEEWHQELAYKFNENSAGRLGHGPQSMAMVMRICNTPYTSPTNEELAAIRWHSYTYDVTSYDINALNDSNRRIPLVHLIQFADQLAITDY